jgi:hypothetical protein
MMDTVLILFAAGAVSGLTVGSKVAMKEVEIMFTLARSGRARGNRIWEGIKTGFKSNKTWMDLKRKYKVNNDWNEAKKNIEVNKVWRKVRTDLEAYSLKSASAWESIRDSQKPGKFNLSNKYLISETSDTKL